MKNQRGFTLIELLVVIGIIAILAGVVIVALNPARQFAQARNAERQAHVTAILNSIGHNMVDNNGVFTCNEDGAGGIDPIPTASTTISSAGYNLYDCVVPTYISDLPLEPTAGTFTSTADYDTGYEIVRDAVTQRITISVPTAVQELGVAVHATR